MSQQNVSHREILSIKGYIVEKPEKKLQTRNGVGWDENLLPSHSVVQIGESEIRARATQPGRDGGDEAVAEGRGGGCCYVEFPVVCYCIFVRVESLFVLMTEIGSAHSSYTSA